MYELSTEPSHLPISSKIPAVHNLIAAFLSNKSAKTINAYRSDLTDFASYLNVSSIDDAASRLFSNGQGQANLFVLQYRDTLHQKSLSPATINRRLAALRSMVKLAKTLGIIAWELSVPSVKSKSFRNTSGCGLDGVRILLKSAGNQRNKIKATRDVCIIRLLFDLGLRRGEVCRLKITDVELNMHRLKIFGKGRTEQEYLTLPDQTEIAIQQWLQIRPETDSDALFLNCSRDGSVKHTHITDSGLYKMIRSLGQKSMVRARPHGIRHTAITTVLDKMGGNVRIAQRFARHSSPSITLIYDDNRTDLSGQASQVLASAV